MSEMPTKGISIVQCLFGYNDGHRLLAASGEISEESAATLLPYSDLISGIVDRNDPYWTGLPLPAVKKYALMRTWPAPEMPRPGCVWTHVLLIDFGDIAKFHDLSVLSNYVRRPRSREDLSDYVKKLVVSPNPGPIPRQSFDPTETIRFLRTLYGPRKGSSNYTYPLQDALIFAGWSQQWPRLRRSFSFQTANIGQVDVQARFDLRIASSSPRNLLDESVDRWEIEAGRDLQRGNMSGFRRFLWRYGSDLKNGKSRFSVLAELYCSLVSPETAGGFSESVESVFNHFPDVDDAATLKNDLLGLSDSEWSMFHPPEPIDAINFALQRPNFSEGALLIERNLHAVESLMRDKPTELLALTETAVDKSARLCDALVGTIAQVAAPETFLALAANFPSVRSKVISKKPSLLNHDAVSGIKPSELIGMIETTKVDFGLLMELAPRLLRVESLPLTELFFGAAPSQMTVLVVKHILARENIARSWVAKLSDVDRLVIADAVLQNALSTSQLADGISLFRWDTKIGARFSIERWSSTIQRLDDDVEGMNHQWLSCFLLALALLKQQRGSERLFEYSFQTVHDDMAVSRLPYGAFDLIAPYLADVPFWQLWDTCLRLRISVAEAFVFENLSKTSFKRLTNDKKTQKQLTDSVRRSHDGKKYLKS